jgi:FkbM family methyltransferase
MADEDMNVVAPLADLCRQHGVRCLVQVGAESAAEAAYVATVVGCRAIAIEGRTDCEPPDHHGRVEYHHAVIGATDCQSIIFFHNPNGLGSTLSRDDVPTKGVPASQHRLDTFCRERGIAPDALIIDTEGTTLDVLEGAGALLNDMKVIYAECQKFVIRPGIRPVEEVDKLLRAHGMTAHTTLPSYGANDGQGNYTWVRA